MATANPVRIGERSGPAPLIRHPPGEFVSTSPALRGPITPSPFGFKSNNHNIPAFVSPPDYATVGTPSRSAKGEENFSPDAPMVNRTIGWQTNHSVPYVRIARALPKAYDFLKTPQQFQMMVVRKDTEFSKGIGVMGDDRRSSVHSSHGVVTHRDRQMIQGSFAGTGGNGRQYTVVSIPFFNYKAAEERFLNRPKFPSEVKSAREVWSNWAIEGPIASESGGRDIGEEYRPLVQGQDRVLTATVRGFAFLYDMWGADVMPMTKLWFILKQVDFDDEKPPQYLIRPMQDARMLLSPSELEERDIKRLRQDTGRFITYYKDGLGENRKVKPFQLIPYAHYQHEEPPLSALRYEDEFEVERYGVAIYVGRAQDGTGQMHNNTLLEQAPFNVEALITRPQIFAYIDT